MSVIILAIYILRFLCIESESEVAQLGLTLQPHGSYVHGIFQTRILEWVAISFSRGSSLPRDQTWVSCIAGRFFTTELVKNLPASTGDTGDMGWIPGSGRCPGRRNGNPLQYSCLENPMDRETWAGYSIGFAKRQD